MLVFVDVQRIWAAATARNRDQAWALVLERRIKIDALLACLLCPRAHLGHCDRRKENAW